MEVEEEALSFVWNVGRKKIREIILFFKLKYKIVKARIFFIFESHI